MFLDGKKIVLAVTGSIAAYKAAELVSMMTKEGAEVQVLMTEEATKFITPLTLKVLSRRPVISDLWREEDSWKPEHIAVADWADAFLVAPATAHMIACFAQGLAPEIVSCTYLATKAPVVIAPAMNCKMLEHPATQENLDKLRSRGNVIVESATGTLACGYEGKGRMANLSEILDHLANII